MCPLSRQTAGNRLFQEREGVIPQVFHIDCGLLKWNRRSVKSQAVDVKIFFLFSLLMAWLLPGVLNYLLSRTLRFQFLGHRTKSDECRGQRGENREFSNPTTQ